MDKGVPFFLIDSFARQPFTGNPAGVVLLNETAPADWMQNVGMEVNQAETAFVVPKGDNLFGLRWFTPAAEVDLCGHATLAAAAACWYSGLARKDAEIVFESRSGELICSLDGDEIAMNFPNENPWEFESAGLRNLIPNARFIGQNRLFWFAEMFNEDELRAFNPNQTAIAELGLYALSVTARSNPGANYDFVSRLFAPVLGIPEDPVTGAAHCALAPYWAPKLDSLQMVGYQASPRGGYVKTEVSGNRVKLVGNYQIVIQGFMSMPDYQ